MRFATSFCACAGRCPCVEAALAGPDQRGHEPLHFSGRIVRDAGVNGRALDDGAVRRYDPVKRLRLAELAHRPLAGTNGREQIKLALHRRHVDPWRERGQARRVKLDLRRQEAARAADEGLRLIPL